MLKVVIGAADRSGENSVGDAGCCGSLERYSDVEFIITFQIGIRNDVTNLLFVFLPVILRQMFRCLHDVIFQRPGSLGNAKCLVQSRNDRFFMLSFHLPELHRAGITAFSGIRNIKHIAQLRFTATHIQKSYALLDKIRIAPTRVFSPINGRKNTLSAQSIFCHADVAAKNDPNCSPP